MHFYRRNSLITNYHFNGVYEVVDFFWVAGRKGRRSKGKILEQRVLRLNTRWSKKSNWDQEIRKIPERVDDKENEERCFVSMYQKVHNIHVADEWYHPCRSPQTFHPILRRISTLNRINYIGHSLWPQLLAILIKCWKILIAFINSSHLCSDRNEYWPYRVDGTFSNRKQWWNGKSCALSALLKHIGQHGDIDFSLATLYSQVACHFLPENNQ